MMLFRALVILGSITIASLFLSENWSSQARIEAMAPSHLWGQWGDVSLRLIKSARLEAYFRDLARRHRFSGTVLVAEQGTVLYQEAFGEADLAQGLPVTDSTAFQLASVSKVFTATAVLKLYEEGRLDLDDEVATHLPGWPYAGMTIRHLLHHRSGLARYMAVASWYWKNWRDPLPNAEVLRQYVRHRPVHFFRPGRGFNYCNTNYVILACLVEQVSGRPFAQYMREEIFEPLDMRQAMIYSRVTDPDIPQEAIGYKAGRRGYYRAANDYIDGVYGDKGMYASALDLWKFDRALAEGRLLRPETQALAATRPDQGSPYGLGWRLRRYRGQDLTYHFGWWRGFHTCFIRDQAQDRTLIILSNRDQPGRNLRFWQVFQDVAAIWDDPATDPQP